MNESQLLGLSGGMHSTVCRSSLSFPVSFLHFISSRDKLLEVKCPGSDFMSHHYTTLHRVRTLMSFVFVYLVCSNFSLPGFKNNNEICIFPVYRWLRKSRNVSFWSKKLLFSNVLATFLLCCWNLSSKCRSGCLPLHRDRQQRTS